VDDDPGEPRKQRRKIDVAPRGMLGAGQEGTQDSVQGSLAQRRSRWSDQQLTELDLRARDWIGIGKRRRVYEYYWAHFAEEIHMSEYSAFRPCGRDLAELFKSTRQPFLDNLTSNSQLPDRRSTVS
jgi:hypothetical protein